MGPQRSQTGRAVAFTTDRGPACGTGTSVFPKSKEMASNARPRPAGASGLVTTATTSCRSESNNACNERTATPGVQAKTSRTAQRPFPASGGGRSRLGRARTRADRTAVPRATAPDGGPSGEDQHRLEGEPRAGLAGRLGQQFLLRPLIGWPSHGAEYGAMRQAGASAGWPNPRPLPEAGRGDSRSAP